MTKTPIAIFAYNRPSHLDRLCYSLQKCWRLEECDIFIYCDGIKERSHASLVRQTREIARKWIKDFGGMLIEREDNWGLARSIVSGVTELCENYGRVIVLEDDLVVSPDFVNFMLQALNRYANAPQVMQISGFLPPIENPESPDAVFLSHISSWGWGTWQRAWEAFCWNATDSIDKLKDARLRKRFDLENTYPFSNLLRERIEGRNQSWGVLWYWAVFKRDGLVLYPRKSLVWNGGYDGTGVHCGTSSGFNQPSESTFRLPVLGEEITFPDRIEFGREAYNRIVALYRTSFSNTLSTRKKIKNTLSQLKRFIVRRARALQHQYRMRTNEYYRQENLRQVEIERIRSLPRYQLGETNILGKKIWFVDSRSFLSMYQCIFLDQSYKFHASSDYPLIIDCGANIGLTTIYWKLLYPNARVIAFEPDPEIFRVLIKNCEIWQLEDVHFVESAVWVSNSRANFNSEGADGGRLAHLSADVVLEGSKTSKLVSTVRLRDYLQGTIDLLKIDIEGAEIEVLEDCVGYLGNVGHLFLEYHSFANRKQGLDRILSILSESGFRYHLIPQMYSKTPFWEVREYLGIDNSVNIFAFRE